MPDALLIPMVICAGLGLLFGGVALRGYVNPTWRHRKDDDHA